MWICNSVTYARIFRFISHVLQITDLFQSNEIIINKNKVKETDKNKISEKKKITDKENQLLRHKPKKN